MIAHNPTYGDEGTNVNFVEVGNARQIQVRTFERKKFPHRCFFY